MMKLWTNFAKTGAPGSTTNNILWGKYNKDNSKLMILDRRNKMDFINFSTNYFSLVKELNNDNRLNEIEKCVVLYQMGALIGNDIFNEIKVYSTFECSRDIAVSFLKKNESFIDY